MKKLFSWKKIATAMLIAVVAVCGTFAFTTADAEAATYDGRFIYSIDENDEVEIEGLSRELKTDENLIIPGEIDGRKVTTLTLDKRGAYMMGSNPGSVWGKLILPEGLKTINFAGGNFTGELIIPDSVEYIARGAFRGHYEYYTINPYKNPDLTPNSKMSPSDWKHPGFSSLDLGNGVKYIGEEAFEHQVYIGGVLIIPDSVEEIGNLAFADIGLYAGSLRWVEGGDGIDSHGRSYTYSGLTGIVLGKNLKVMGDKSLPQRVCQDINVYIPDSLESVERWGFYNKDRLTFYLSGGEERAKKLNLVDAEHKYESEPVTYKCVYTDPGEKPIEGWTYSNIGFSGYETDGSYVMYVGDTAKIFAVPRPVNTTDNVNLTWTSSKPEVLMIGEGGALVAKGVGKVTVTVYNNGFAVNSWKIKTLGMYGVRLDGANRYDTMANIVAESYPFGADCAIIATAQNYPDALAASGLAGIKNAPILLTATNELSEQTRMTLMSLRAEKVYIVGGKGAIAPAVEADLKSIVGSKNVKRLEGASRIETGLKIYEEGGSQWSDTAILATGFSFADALSISPYAYAKKVPIFLTGQGDGLDEKTKQIIIDGGFKRIIIVGGINAVSDEVYTQLEGYINEENIIRLGGASRYETSSIIADFLTSEEDFSYCNSALATGTNYPDALAGGPLCGNRMAPILLVDSSGSGMICINENLAKLEKKSEIYNVYYLGGTGAVPTETVNKTKAVLGW